jgi:hypothetical protein
MQILPIDQSFQVSMARYGGEGHRPAPATTIFRLFFRMPQAGMGRYL